MAQINKKYVVCLTGQDVGPGFKPKRELVDANCEYDAVKAVVAMHADDIHQSKSTWIIFCGQVASTEAHMAHNTSKNLIDFSLGRVSPLDAKDAPLVLNWPLVSDNREVLENVNA